MLIMPSGRIRPQRTPTGKHQPTSVHRLTTEYKGRGRGSAVSWGAPAAQVIYLCPVILNIPPGQSDAKQEQAAEPAEGAQSIAVMGKNFENWKRLHRIDVKLGRSHRVQSLEQASDLIFNQLRSLFWFCLVPSATAA